jgi:hypothetical protein
VFDEGPVALVAACPPGLTVSLHPDAADAAASRQDIDQGGCGGGCLGPAGHRVVYLNESVAEACGGAVRGASMVSPVHGRKVPCPTARPAREERP